MKNHYNMTKDGHRINSNTLQSKQPKQGSRFNNFSMCLAAITKSSASDDKNNTSKKGVEYTAVIVSGPRKGQEITGVQSLDMFGGDENFQEVVYKPKTKTIKGKDKGENTLPENTDASLVLVGFVDGHYNNGVILGGFPNPNNKERGATSSDGVAVRGKFNGMSYQIDKNGDMKFFNDNADFAMANDGKITISTTTDTEIITQGQTKIDSTGNVEISSAQNVEVSGSSSVALTGPNVSLGSTGAAEKLVLGDALKNYLDNHEHPDSAGPPTTTVPASVFSTKIKVE